MPQEAKAVGTALHRLPGARGLMEMPIGQAAQVLRGVFQGVAGRLGILATAVAVVVLQVVRVLAGVVGVELAAHFIQFAAAVGKVGDQVVAA